MFHTDPDASVIDGVNVLEIFAYGIRCFHGGNLYAGIVERRVQATESGNGLIDHSCDLGLVGDIAVNRHRLMAGAN